VAEKVLIHSTVPLAVFRVYWGRGGGGWLKTSEYSHMGEGSKIAEKPVI